MDPVSRRMSATAALLLLLVINTAHAVPLTLLTDPTARCMDGTQSGYYMQPATTSAGKRNFNIHLQGGGECVTRTACYAALNSSLGSSNYFAKDVPGFGFYSISNCQWNPTLCEWNHVFLPYCTQDLHSGNVIEPSASSWGLYFTGNRVFNAVVEQLVELYDLDNAENIILSGDSAGGIGVWLHVDALQERFPNAHVMGAPVAGFYFPVSALCCCCWWWWFMSIYFKLTFLLLPFPSCCFFVIDPSS
jgi:hypothetical protein